MLATAPTSACRTCVRPSARLTADQCPRCLLAGTAAPLPYCRRCGGPVLAEPVDDLDGVDYDMLLDSLYDLTL
jgi:hypothetical protein